MVAQHAFLFIFWILYCVMHSFLASERVKLFFKKNLIIQRHYRMLYNVIAVVTLLLVLWYQYSIRSFPLLTPSLLIKLLAFSLSLFGGYVMLGCISKYFRMHSGIQSRNNPEKTELYMNGMHGYVRHPLYTGTMIFLFGILLYFPISSNLVAYVSLVAYTILGTILEEKKLREQFGDIYTRYSEQVPRFIPSWRKIFLK